MHEKMYIGELIRRLDELLDRQRDRMEAAADLVANAIMNDGVVHTFGTGHSSIVAQEAFMRAGGLFPVNAILDERVVLSGGSLMSAAMERHEGLAAEILAAHDIHPSDAGIVISNAGRNAAPVEMAMEMRQRGIPVIGITSTTHSRTASAVHSSGKKLMDVADVVLDNGAPHGDACVSIPGLPTAMGPVSTVTGAALIHSVFILAAEKMLARGYEPVALPSGNVETADFTRIQEAMQAFADRIKHL
jgi:uncharacterized phosphosugar-binding protein